MASTTAITSLRPALGGLQGRQPIQRDKTETNNYYLLTLAVPAQELRARGAPNEGAVAIAAGLPLTSFGRDKAKFHDYLLRSSQPVCFEYKGIKYRITVEDVQLFPQGYTALFTEPDRNIFIIIKEPMAPPVLG